MTETHPISAVIIDDELNNCEHLQKLLEKYCPKVTVTGMAHDAVSGIQLIEQVQPQLIFLDIKMPGGSGFDLLEAIPNRHFEVIFVTAFDHYAIKAIRFCAFDYLLKPVNVLELQQAVARVVEKNNAQKNQLAEQWSMLESNQKSGEKRIALPTSERVVFVKTAEISRCKGENNYTFVHLSNGEKVLVSRTLKEFEELLEEEGFIRVHQSHLVNKAKVQSYEKGDGGYLLMQDGAQISISRMRKEKVLKILSGK